jgi:hypothetical protein
MMHEREKPPIEPGPEPDTSDAGDGEGSDRSLDGEQSLDGEGL